MSDLNTKVLGRSGIAVSIVGLGTAFLGRSPRSAVGASAGRFELDPEIGAATVHAALDNGIRLIDTAPYYGTEPTVGGALQSRPDWGAGVVVNTKVGRPNVDSFDYSADGARASVERSLRRLGRDRLDIVSIHDAVGVPMAEVMGPGGAFEALAQLRDEKVIGAVGTACYDPEINAGYIETGGFDVAIVADACSLLNHRICNRILPAAAKHNTGLIIANPLERGLLAEGPIPGRKYADRSFSPEVLEHVGVLQSTCERHGVTLLAAALRWVTRLPQVASAIPGAAIPAEATANAAAASAPIPETFWEEFEPLLKAWDPASIGVRAAG